MLTLKNNKQAQGMFLSGDDKAIKPAEDFAAFCLADYQLLEKNLLDEYNEKYEHLQKLRDRKIKEYNFMLLVVGANVRQQQMLVDMDATIELEQQLAALSFDNVGASYTLQNWRSNIGEKQLIVILCEVMNYFIYQFEIKSKLTEQQILHLSIRLISAQPHLRILELVFVLQRALNGDYGQTYNHIGIDTILGWLNRFYHESADYTEGRIQNMRIDEARGTQPWLEEEKRLVKYRDGQLEKKRINDAIWGHAQQEAEKQQRHEAYRQAILQQQDHGPQTTDGG